MISQSAQVTVKEINDIQRLEDLRLFWNGLQNETPGGSFFHTLDWLQTYWRFCGSGQRLRVLVVSHGGRPLGILPLTVIREKTRLGWLRVLTYPLHDWGTFFGPIGPNPTATLTLAMQHISQTPRDWDLLDLRWVNGQQWDRQRTPWAMQRAGFQPRCHVWKQTAVVQMDCGWQQYWSSRAKKFRHNVARQQRRLAEQGEVRHIRYRPAGAACGDGDPRWDLYDQCVQLAQQSWQGASATGTTLCHRTVAGFFRETHALAARNGMLDLNLLTVADQPVAFAYNYCHQGRVTGMRVGFDPRYARYGAGNVMWRNVLEDSFRRNDTVLDFGVGSLDIKRAWATDLLESYRYTHYPLTVPRVQLLRLKHWNDMRRQAPGSQLADYFGTTPRSTSR